MDDRPRVWIVDDSRADAETAAEAIAADCETELFGDGSELLERLHTSSPPDLLVLDVLMPGVSGLDVVRFVRAQPEPLAQLPILLLTGLGDPAQTAEGLGAGANDYVHKPFAAAELRARLSALLRGAALLRRAAEAEAAVRALLAGSPDAVLALDDDERVTYANTRALEILERPVTEVVGKSFSELTPMSLDSILEAGGSVPPDVHLGSRAISPSARRLPAGNPHVIVTLRDVTDRRRQDQRRLDFYSVIAHDLRTPLTAMSLRAEAILSGRRGPLPVEVIGDVRVMDRNARSMLALINDFLDLARLEATSFKLRAATVDLVEVVRGSVEDFLALAEAAQLQLSCAPACTSAPVLGDRQRLAQVVSNLLGNAIKYTPSGGRIMVEVTRTGGDLEVHVSDTGPGVPDDLLPVLFERFTRASPHHGPTGTGLGLMIVREIVEAHGGKVGVERRVGGGSRFWFRLPATESDGRVRAHA